MWQSQSKEEWLCTKDDCQTNNFSERSVCRQCNYPRHGLLLPLKNSNLGDWYCQERACYEYNFGSRQYCHRCNSKRKGTGSCGNTPSLMTYNRACIVDWRATKPTTVMTKIAQPKLVR